MKKIAIILVGLSLAGCQQFTSVRNWLADPKTAVALAQAKGWAQVATCSIGNVAVVAVQIENAVKANKAALDTTGKVYTVSAIVCTSLGGTVTSLQSAQ